MRRATIVLVVVLGASSAARAQFCPSYTPDVEPKCGYYPVAGTNPTVAEWQDIFDLVARGPAVWGDAGPTVGDIPSGCATPTMVGAEFPCEILKAIARVETGWQHFCKPTTPSSQVGQASRTIVSFDCGYGIGQVTSGMRAADPKPTFDPMRVVAEPTYNLATGTQILAQKWRAVKCVGERNPQLVEDWYTSAWAYNGLAYKNNPTNPMYKSTRGVWNPSVGGDAPYQEKVFGYVEHPPTPQHWTAVALAYPKLSEMGSSGSPGALSEPECESPTSCAGKRPTHISTCFGGQNDLGTVADLAEPPPPPDLTSAPAPADLAMPPTEVHPRIDGGCACQTSGVDPSSFVAALFVLAALRRRS